MPRVNQPPETSDNTCQCSHCGQSAMFSDALMTDNLCVDCYPRFYVTCDACGCETWRDNLSDHPVSGNLVCPDCYRTRDCDCCGDTFDEDDIIGTPNDEQYCEECYSDNYTSCCGCGETIYRETCCLDDWGEAYCEDCYHDIYRRCDACGDTHHHENISYSDRYGGELCPDCYEVHERGSLHEYDYRPNPNWHGTDGRKRGVRYLGIEIEAENEGRSDIDDDVNHVVGSETTWYAKKDGSLSSDSAEFVSHPGTIDYWRSYNWSAFSDLRDRGWRSYNASDSSCGIHVHVSRDSFSRLGLIKLALFTNNISDLMVRASRRRSGDLRQWARCEKTDNKSAIYKARCRSNARYEGINYQNDRTVEFRIFRGTLHTASIVRNLDFVIAVCAFAENASYQDVTADNAERRFLDWLMTDNARRLIGHKQARNLTAWLDR